MAEPPPTGPVCQDADFYPAECIADYSFEAVDQSMMGTGEFGLFPHVKWLGRLTDLLTDFNAL